MKATVAFKNIDIRVLPLGIDTIIFKPNEFKRFITPNLLYVGRIVELKRIHLCIDALYKLKTNGFIEAHLDIIGPIVSQNYMDQLMGKISRLNLTSNFTYHGPKLREELVDFYKNSNLLCLPSLNESFGMVMIESMACGTPVAAIDIHGGPREIIINGENGILAEVDNYADCILDYFNKPSKMEKMKIQARRTAVDKYSSGVTYRLLSDSIQSCIK
jgi:glycosyltransferase involved in cell wall biosynthesis